MNIFKKFDLIMQVLKAKDVVVKSAEELTVKDGKGAVIKKGWETTEFKVLVLTQIASVLTLCTGVVQPAVGAILMALSACAYTISRGLAKQGIGGASGEQTTEFWVSLSQNIVAVVTAVSGVLPAEYSVIVATVVNSVYAYARGLAKTGAAIENTEIKVVEK